MFELSCRPFPLGRLGPERRAGGAMPRFDPSRSRSRSRSRRRSRRDSRSRDSRRPRETSAELPGSQRPFSFFLFFFVLFLLLILMLPLETRSPCVGWEGSATKIDRKKKTWYPYSNPSTEGPSQRPFSFFFFFYFYFYFLRPLHFDRQLKPVFFCVAMGHGVLFGGLLMLLPPVDPANPVQPQHVLDSRQSWCEHRGPWSTPKQREITVKTTRERWA